MADLSWLHAVPIGLLMFAGTTFGVVRRTLGKRASRTGFPTLGAKLGLSHVNAETPGAAGTLKGAYQGHRVRLESETRARVVVSLRCEVALELRNYEQWKRTPAGYETVAFEDQKLNQWLSNRYANPALRADLARDAAIRELLSRLRHDPHLREFTLSSDRVELIFDYGVRGLFPVAQAEQALTFALTLAQHVEALAERAPSTDATSDSTPWNDDRPEP